MKLFPLFILLLFLMVNCQKPEIPVTTGVSAELAKHRKTIISEIQYDLIFRIPSALSEKIEASSTILFNLKNADHNLLLDFKGDTTATYSLTCNGQTTVQHILNGHLVIGKSLLKKGKNKIQLDFTSPDWSLNRNPEFMYTLFVPDRASTAFPCFDQPDLKARFSLLLEIPAGWKAVSNGSEYREQINKPVKRIWFRPTQPLPTYLFAFTAGIFDTISQTKNGKTCILYHREKAAETMRNNVDSVFSLLFRSLDEIEKYTAIKYPFEKYDLVAIPSFQYNGMEHPGVTLYRASSLFPDARATRQQLLKRANLIAHETAHMWFGDLVTMPWFDEVWLKEVFANFIADKVVAPIFPEVNFDLLFLTAHYDAAYSVDRTAGANAIGQKLANMKDAGSLYGSIIYHKAPVVMKMLEHKIGAESLRKGLRKYLRQNAYGNAGWQELIDILNPQKSAELPKWSEQWVNEAGRPEIKAMVAGNTLILEQTDPFGKGRIWPMEIDLAYSKHGLITNKKVGLNSGKSTIKNIFEGGNPDWIYLNAKGNVYGFVGIDPVSRKYLLKNLALLKDDLLRAAVLTDMSENLYGKKLGSDKYLDMLISAIPKEQNPVIYERMLSYLETCFLYKTTEAERSACSGPLEILLWHEYALRKTQKTAIMNTLIKLASSNRSLVKLQEFLSGKDAKGVQMLSPEQQYELALQLALKMPEKATAILDFQQKRISNPDKKEEFRFVRQSVQAGKTDRKRFFSLLLLAVNREHEPWVDQAIAFLNHPLREKESLEYIRPALDELLDIKQSGDIFFPKSWLDNLLKGHNSPQARAIVEQFLSDHPDYPEDLKMKILQSADHLRYASLR